MGWGWGREDSYAFNNSVNYNHIHDHMCGGLFDGGGVYTLGPQGSYGVRSEVAYNYIHDQCDGMNGGLYHDSGSGFFNTHDNVLKNIGGNWWLVVNPNDGKNDPLDPYTGPPHATYQFNIDVYDNYLAGADLNNPQVIRERSDRISGENNKKNKIKKSSGSEKYFGGVRCARNSGKLTHFSLSSEESALLTTTAQAP